MVSWKLTDIAKAVNGEIVNLAEEEKIVKGFQQDSRKIEKDFLFVPLVAERDGHDYIKEAREAGAVASFWSEDLKDAPKDFPLILVEDSLDALQQTAQWYLKNVNPKVIAITGSNGKTTTKDMVNKVLEKKYQTHKTAGNFNNHIG
ncbi:MAG: UDP-N-acetylmuramoyl-tripeptide--D-alanyl-D-alanine ligase, partial [Atopostipes suicloacalis]|nr:UDP-N-acetylmuramoyl-tripeptide--D-alanyl-D-alanine ligase [Atopostipes suicloacalis]